MITRVQSAGVRRDKRDAQWPGRLLAIIFCVLVSGGGAALVWVGWRGVITQHLVITSRTGGTFQPTVSSTIVYTGLAAVRVGSGMIAAGLLLASWGMTWAASVVKVWRGGVSAYRTRPILWWISLAVFVLTFLLLTPPWIGAHAVAWLAVIAAFVLLGAQRRASMIWNIGRALFIAAVAVALIAGPLRWSGVGGLLLFGGVFAHLFTLRFPQCASWTALAIEHAEPNHGSTRPHEPCV
ncbi:MAG: hypothetical protein IT430_04760 [Phycisphaerales bacterium]|nr:hypothetical protein [Phycisphaerales bacterium]